MSLQTIGTFATWALPRKTATADTAITHIANPKRRKRTKCTTAKVTAAGTAHTLTALRPLARTTLTAAVAAGGTSAILARDPGLYAANHTADGWPVPLASNNAIAANDLLLIRNPMGDCSLATVSAATTNSDGTVTVTIGAAPTGGYASGADVFFLGITTDTDPRTGLAHPSWAIGASAQTSLDGNGGSVVQTVGLDEPILFYDNNATAAGSIDLLTGTYADA